MENKFPVKNSSVWWSLYRNTGYLITRKGVWWLACSNVDRQVVGLSPPRIEKTDRLDFSPVAHDWVKGLGIWPAVSVRLGMYKMHANRYARDDFLFIIIYILLFIIQTKSLFSIK